MVAGAPFQPQHSQSATEALKWGSSGKCVVGSEKVRLRGRRHDFNSLSCDPETSNSTFSMSSSVSSNWIFSFSSVKRDGFVNLFGPARSAVSIQ